MLKPSIRPQFIERILTSPTGEQYRVVFEVTIVAGQVKARAISAELVEKTLAIAAAPILFVAKAAQVFCLPCASTAIESVAAEFSPFTNIVSPFTSLLFFTSQPTRAPSFAY
jgi:hypothetical protein